MKTFKIIDLCWQVLALVAGVLLYIKSTPSGTDNLFILSTENFFIIYYIVGGAQLLSFFTHLFFSNTTWYHKKDRKAYGKVILGTFLSGLISWLLSGIITTTTALIFGGALIATPIFAIWYFNIGLTELRTIRNKELVHLK